MSDKANDTAHASVKVYYSSPSGTQTISHSLASPQPTDTKSKITYLNELRSSTKRMQEDINAFLTAKMGEDKAQAAASGTNAKINKSRDEEEEENYGEEKVEED
ncbi:hypothetical protein H2198_004519 [Neophaeococcomyces mojaviensis]|uniref:Uncharacterized protein n=1 Tax=Neophaeococcomyces mojaviensis TaxID=3383035 RepID=A0ACC3A8E1_9EURO|nr:hypothetical protein H2198_004519 [Knufia sp. JES_112]